LSKPNYRLINAGEFFQLHKTDFRVDPDTGEIYTGEGYNRTPISEYLTDLEKREDKQHWFKPRGGSGNSSHGSGNQSAVIGEKNPWAKGSFNLTRQMQIARINPELAARLQREAGR
jgi:hypothetical protein